MSRSIIRCLVQCE